MNGIVFNILPLNVKDQENGTEYSIYRDVVIKDNVSYPLYKFKWNKTDEKLKIQLHKKKARATKQGTYNITDGAGSEKLIDDLFKTDKPNEAYINWIKQQKISGGVRVRDGENITGFATMKDFLEQYPAVEQQLMNHKNNVIQPANKDLYLEGEWTEKEGEKNYAGYAYDRFLSQGKKMLSGFSAKFINSTSDMMENKLEEQAEALNAESKEGTKAVGQAVGSQTLTNEEIQTAQAQLDTLADALGTGAYNKLSKRLMKKFLDNQGRVRPDLTRQEGNNLKQLIATQAETAMNSPSTTGYKQYYTQKRPRQTNPRFQVSQERIDTFAEMMGAEFKYENLIRDSEGVVIGYDKSYGQPIHSLDDPEIVGVRGSPAEDSALLRFENGIREAHRERDNLPPDFLIHKHIDEGAIEAKAPVKGQSIPTGADAGEQIAEDGEEAKNEIVGVQPHQNLGAGAGAVVQPNIPLQPSMGAGYAGGVVNSAMGRAFRRRQVNQQAQQTQQSAEMDAEANRVAELGIGATRTYDNAPPPVEPAIQATTRQGDTPQTMIQQGIAEADEKASIDQGAIQDKYADVSMYGYDRQVSMFAKKQGRDFTYTKEMIRKSKDAPSKDPKIKKKQTKGLLAEWGYTIQIKELKTNDYEECLEVYTFIHLARDMYRLERNWKRALTRTKNQSANNLNKMVQDAQTGGAGNVGLVIQTPNAIPLGNFAGMLGSNAGSNAGSNTGTFRAPTIPPSRVINEGGNLPKTGEEDDMEFSLSGSGSSSSSSSGSDNFTAFSNQSGGGSGSGDSSDRTQRGYSEENLGFNLENPSSNESGSDRRRLAGFTTDINYSNTHQERPVGYSNVIATNAQGIISNNRMPNAPQGVQTIRKPKALNTTYSHRPSTARGGYKAKTLRKHKPRLNVKEVQFKMKRHRINSNLGFVNLLKQNPRQEGVMPPFRLRNGNVKLNRIKF